jgi:hypothetical protein
MGARDISPPSAGFYEPYSGITPSPHSFDDMVHAYQHRGARQININGNTRHCEGTLPTAHNGSDPCFDFREAAEGTGSIDLDGNALIFDLPPGAGSGTPPAEFVGLVTDAVHTLATRVPIDITTGLRNDTTNPHMIDATRFIKLRVPSCQLAMPISDTCWTEAMGVPHRSAVGQTDRSTFYRVLPGTRVRFTIYFQNDGVYPGDEAGITLFHAYIDVLADGVSRLDTREVFILVPARNVNPG